MTEARRQFDQINAEYQRGFARLQRLTVRMNTLTDQATDLTKRCKAAMERYHRDGTPANLDAYLDLDQQWDANNEEWKRLNDCASRLGKKLDRLLAEMKAAL